MIRDEYDPFEDLASNRVAVGLLDLPASDGWLIRDDRMVLLNFRLDAVRRRVMAAHMAAHLDLSHRPIPARDVERAHAQEVHAQRLTATRLIPIDALVYLLSNVSADAVVIAQRLAVTVPTLAKRVRNLSRDEWRRIRRKTDQRIRWPRVVPEPALRCAIVHTLSVPFTASEPIRLRAS